MNYRLRRIVLTAKLTVCVWFGLFSFCMPVHAQKAIDFAHEIVPILRKHCAECHAGDNRKGSFSINTRSEVLKGSENGPVLDIGKADASRLVELVLSEAEDERMPPEGKRLEKNEVDLLKRWIDGGMAWDDGFAFKAPAYEPPLKPRKPELPAARDGRTHPIDRIIDGYLAASELKTPDPISDPVFARRASLDLIGLLPETSSVAAFLVDDGAKRRAGCHNRGRAPCRLPHRKP